MAVKTSAYPSWNDDVYVQSNVGVPSKTPYGKIIAIDDDEITVLYENGTFGYFGKEDFVGTYNERFGGLWMLD